MKGKGEMGTVEVFNSLAGARSFLVFFWSKTNDLLVEGAACEETITQQPFILN